MMHVLQTVLFLIVILTQDVIYTKGEEIKHQTPNEQKYVILSTLGITVSNEKFIHFKVKSCHDVHVALMSGNTENDPLYEIALGGWKNSKSVIRTQKQGQHVKSEQSSVVSCLEYKKFWISWNDFTINIGRGETNTSGKFLTWTNSTGLLSIINVGFYTAFGATGEWIFYKQDIATDMSTQSTEVSCMCPCANIGKWYYLDSLDFTKEELKAILQEELDQIKSDISVDKKSTSSYKRRTISQPDNRKSSQAIGFVGILIICVPVAIFVISDMINLYVYLTLNENT